MTSETPTRHQPRLLPQLAKFGVVGAVGVLVNLVVFNALLITPLGRGHWGPIAATVIANGVAIATNYVGNRYWAFASDRRANVTREGIEFFIVSIAGLAIPVLCVWFSAAVLGFTNQFAYNIANNVVGLVLGTVFRFAFYRWWVFSPQRADRAAIRVPEPVLTTTGSLPSTPDRGLVGD